MKACMMDMDGTLLDTMPFWKQAEQKVFARYGVQQVPPAVQNRLCMLCAPDWACAATGQEKEFLWDAIADEMETHFRYNIPAKPGAAGFLQALRTQGIPCWLVTASRLEHAEAALRNTGLYDDFDRVMTTRGLSFRKENPAFFTWLAGEMAVAPADLCVVEDSLGIVRAAKEAGCSVLGIDDPIHDTREAMRSLCDVFTADFSALPSLLPTLWQRR